MVAFKNCNKVDRHCSLKQPRMLVFPIMAIMAAIAVLAIFTQLGLQFPYGKVP
jgi:hypothetical protein